MRRMEGWIGARDELMKAYDVFEVSSWFYKKKIRSFKASKKGPTSNMKWWAAFMAATGFQMNWLTPVPTHKEYIQSLAAVHLFYLYLFPSATNDSQRLWNKCKINCWFLTHYNIHPCTWSSIIYIMIYIIPKWSLKVSLFYPWVTASGDILLKENSDWLWRRQMFTPLTFFLLES